MKNTLQKGTLSYRIFRWKGRYIGICKETGFIEEGQSINEVKDKLINGTIVLLRAVKLSKQNLVPSLNTSPPLKYAIYFHITPILSMIEMMKNSSESGFYSFNQSIALGSGV